METVKVKINGIEVEVQKDATILEAAHQAGVRIPTLCYLKKINAIAACRICLVEATGVRGLAAATGCALTHDEAIEAIHKALAVKCAAVLADAGVYKHTEAGRAGVMRFLNSIGYTEA